MNAPAHDQLVGRALGEFVLRARIGEGGFGAVYRATQPALDREAVVKVLHTRLHASRAAADRFLREARLASKLDHPYAAHIYAFGAEPDNTLWIAMELVRGTPLDEILRIQGPLPLERFVPLLDRICEVVHTAHEQGIIHRDLKPANVMVLARAGRLLPKLLDFGIAKGLATRDVATDETLDDGDGADLALAHTGRVPALTQRGAIVGSPRYMAPEQWLDAGQVDARTDLYALGILAYEALTGKPPFNGATITDIAIAHAEAAPPPLPRGFPSALDAVFAKVLAKAPEDRYADALELAAAFRQASGVGADALSLPALDPAVRDAEINGAPQPIAEALVALEAARNPHQARDALAQVGRTIARYLGLLAVACRSRVKDAGEPAGISETLRALYRRSLADREWLELAGQLTRSWGDRRDAYPIPELVDAFADANLVHGLTALCALREAESPSEDTLLAVLETTIGRLGQLLRALAFLRDYALVVTLAGGIAERWMGVRRAQRTTMPVRGTGLAAGIPALLDKDGVPVLSLGPLFQVAAPTPGAPLDLFLFDGRDARGARLVALPSAFEHHDDALWEWFRAELSGSFDDADPTATDEKPPYRGLSAFSADDSAMFFGREKLVDAFVNRLRVQPLLAVVGRSGAGKSSFVQAGVIPALPERWRTITLRPGPSPLAAVVARLEHADLPTAGLRAAVARDHGALGELLRSDAAARGPILIVVDQLEELFTLCQGADERRVFAEAIAGAARDVDDPVRVVFTLRDDFLLRIEQIPALRNRIGQGLQLLTVPVVDDLLRIVVEPARRAGYEFESPDLPAEMVRQVADQPGALALISFAASKLWELRDRHFKQLTRKAYDSLGGVGGALARHAELTLDQMPPEERALTREAFRHLVTAQQTRAVIARKELRQLLGGSEHGDAVIEKLVAARLLVASEDESGAETIEIVHEALLVAWPRLVEWRREDAEGARFHEQLRSAANQWDDRGRPAGLLWRGDALADYTRWRARHAGTLTDIEAAFADASLIDAMRARRARRTLVAASFVVLGAGIVGLLVFNARVSGQRAKAEAAADELHQNLQRQYEDQGRRLVLGQDPLQALAFLDKARELGAAGPSHDFLVAQAVRASDGELFEVRHDNAVFSVAFSHDGAQLVTGGADHTARIWNTRTGALVHSIAHDDAVVHVELSPDDTLVLTSDVRDAVALWSARDGRLIRRLHDGGQGRGLWTLKQCATFSRDGKLVVAAAEDTVVVWELPAGDKRFASRTGGEVTACAISPDGRSIAAGDATGAIRVFDATGRATVELHQREKINSIRFAPDGASLLTASDDHNAVVWELPSGTLRHSLGHRGAIASATYSADGRRVVTASGDRTAAVWDSERGAQLALLEGHLANVDLAAFTPDGAEVVTASADASVRLWDVATGAALARWRGHQDHVRALAFDATGARAATAGEDGVVIVWAVKPQDAVTRLAGHTGLVWDGGISADGKRLVTAGQDGTARVWDLAAKREIATLRDAKSKLANVALSSDGSIVATGGDDGAVRLWDAATGAEQAVLVKSPTPIRTVSMSADDKSIVAVSEDGAMRCWDTKTRRLRFENPSGQPIAAASFDPTGTKIITTGDGKTTRLWDLAGKPIATFPEDENPVTSIIDPTGARVLTAVTRDRLKIWDAATGKHVVDLVGHSGRITCNAWSWDGTRVITGSLDETVRIWDARTGDTLASIPHRGGVFFAAFTPDGKSIVLGDASGIVEMRELPHYDGSDGELHQLMQCRVPFEVRGDRVEPRDRDRRACVM